MTRIKINILLFIIIIYNCDKDEIKISKIKISEVFPQYAKIGERITIRGHNLDHANFVYCNDRMCDFTLNDKNEITFNLPTLNNENIKLEVIKKEYIDSLNTFIVEERDTFIFYLVGAFPINTSFIEDIKQIQVVNKKIAFCAISKNIYKTDDGGYNWHIVSSFDTIDYVSSFYFLDEYSGWVGLGNFMGDNLYYTNNGGKDYKFKCKIGNIYSGETIEEIRFLSSTEGFILNGKGKIYYTENNSDYTLIYDFPYADQSSGAIDFHNLYVIDKNHVWATGKRELFRQILIYRNNGNFDFIEFSSVSIGRVQFYNEEYGRTIIGHKLYLSEDGGQQWSRVNDTILFNFAFIDKYRGIGISSNESYDYHIIMETASGGYNWKKILELNDFEYTTDIDMKDGFCLIAGYRGKLWKYIKE